MSQKNLHLLGLNWALDSNSYYSESELESRQHRQENVIEGLQPHSNLRKLKVKGYEGLTLSWLTPLCVPNLVQISLDNCKCEHLGSLWKFPHLKILKLGGMFSLKFIDASAGVFPLLEELSFFLMPNLEGWSSSSSSSSQAPITQQAVVFPCLKSVRLQHCPKLKGAIPLAWSPVQHVDIDGGSCNGMVLALLQDLPSIPSLHITRFVELEYFPPGTLTNLAALYKLFIINCLNLKTLPVELNSLATLTVLEISDCPNLVSLAEEREGGLKNLSSLKVLHIDDCGALKRLPELEKASLVTLTISDCPRMKVSKEDFEHLVVLEELRLYRLPKLTCFPEGIKHSAATLRHLQFQPCYAYCAPVDLLDWIGTILTSLEYLKFDAPRNWKVLPQWMQHLTALKTLEICTCNEELVERWRNREAEKRKQQLQHDCPRSRCSYQ